MNAANPAAHRYVCPIEGTRPLPRQTWHFTHDERIRALEAELAETLRQRDGWNRIANQENADKKRAEAELARCKRGRGGGRVKRGGRESGGLPGGSAEQPSNRMAAAANPAAPGPEWEVYRKRPIVVWVRGPIERSERIDTLEGTLFASVGDYIIRGVKGELYPCKPDVFVATYEPAVYHEIPWAEEMVE